MHPFVLEKDNDYKDDRRKYALVLKQVKNAGTEDKSIRIIEKYEFEGQVP